MYFVGQLIPENEFQNRMKEAQAKKDVEKWILQSFQENCDDFPKGSVRSFESPDFIIQVKPKKRFGLELTSLYPDWEQQISNPQEGVRRRLAEKVVDMAGELLEGKGVIPLYIKVAFELSMLDESGEMITAVRLANAIYDSTKNQNAGSSFSLQLNRDGLPASVKHVLLIHHPGMNQTVWAQASQFVHFEDIIEAIQEALLAKEEKLKLYRTRNLNAYWLLLVVDLLEGDKKINVFNRLYRTTFESSFNRVYLFELLKGRVIRLV